MSNAEHLFTYYSREDSFGREFTKQLDKILAVMRYVGKEENMDRYYYYNMRRRTVFYFNGERRLNAPK